VQAAALAAAEAEVAALCPLAQLLPYALSQLAGPGSDLVDALVQV
jgi:hypothetical protein